MSLPAHHLELLAPAKTADIGREAILHGADAVYIGGPGFGARHNATNSVADIAGLCGFAHRYHARIFATLNTILHDNELEAARDLLRRGLYARVCERDKFLRRVLANDSELARIGVELANQFDAHINHAPVSPVRRQRRGARGFPGLFLHRRNGRSRRDAGGRAARVRVAVASGLLQFRNFVLQHLQRLRG